MDSLIKPVGHELARGSRAVNSWLSKQCPEVGTNPITLAALVHDSVPDPDHPAHPRNPWIPASRHQRHRVRHQHEPEYDSTAVVEPAWQQGWMAQTPLAKYRMANGLAGDAPTGETREERNKRVFRETAQWFAWTKQHCDARGWGVMGDWGAERREGAFAYEMVEMGGKQAEAREDVNFTSQAAPEGAGAERPSHSSPGSGKFQVNPAAPEFTPSSSLSPTSVSRKSSPDEKKKRDEDVQAGGFRATAGHDATDDEEMRYRAMLDRCLPRAQNSSSAAEQNSGAGAAAAKEQVGEASSSTTTAAVVIDENNAVTTDQTGEQEAGLSSAPAVTDDDDDDDDDEVLIGEGSQDSSSASSSWETDSLAASASAEEPVVVVGASIVADDVDFDKPAAAASSPPLETAWARRVMADAGQRCWSPIFAAEVRGFRPRSSVSGTGA